MDRDEAIERMQEYVDGEFTETETDEMRRLIASDEDVEQAWREHKKYTTTMLEALGKLRPRSPDFESKVMDRIRAQKGQGGGLGNLPAPPRRRVILWPYVTAAAVLLLTLLLVLWLRSGSGFGHVGALSGTAELIRGKGADQTTQELTAGSDLQIGDRLRTGESSSVTLGVRGNRVVVGPLTAIDLYADENGVLIFIRRGTLSIAHRAGARNLRVQAQHVVVRPVAAPAAAQLRIEPDGAVFTRATTGSWRASNPTQEQKFNAGEALTIPQGGDIQQAPAD